MVKIHNKEISVYDNYVTKPEWAFAWDGMSLGSYNIGMPELRSLSTNRFPEMLTLHSYTKDMDKFVNTFSNKNYYQFYLDKVKSKARKFSISQNVRSALYHSIMVNDAVNTLKSVELIRQLKHSDSGKPKMKNSMLNPDIVYTAQRSLQPSRGIYTIPNYMSSTTAFSVANGYSGRGKPIYCFNRPKSHVKLQATSAWNRIEAEVALQPGESFRQVSKKTPWFSNLQAKHPNVRLIGLEPIDESIDFENTDLKAQHAKYPWLVEKMAMIALNTKDEKLLAEIHKQVPQLKTTTANLEKQYCKNERIRNVLRHKWATNLQLEKHIDQALKKSDLSSAIKAIKRLYSRETVENVIQKYEEPLLQAKPGLQIKAFSSVIKYKDSPIVKQFQKNILQKLRQTGKDKKADQLEKKLSSSYKTPFWRAFLLKITNFFGFY